MTVATPTGSIAAADHPLVATVLPPDAQEFLAELHRTFNGRRVELLAARNARQDAIARGERPAFLPETEHIRSGDWTISPVPAALADRRVEITGPVERKMVINALNSGARMFMADFEDANSPSWTNNLEGQVNLSDAIAGTIEFANPDGKRYQLSENVATLLVRPRGWHLEERHFLVDGEPMSGGLFDVGLYMWRNGRRLVEQPSGCGQGPFFYLPKLQSHLEARLWNEVFSFIEQTLGIPHGSMRATVLIEHVLAAFEMEEILYELRDHAAGLNAGRWDYIFSVIKVLREDSAAILPDRDQVTMTVPFMRAYSEQLVRACHRRGAHAMGGMAAFIPSRRDAEVNALALEKVTADKRREANDGFDGTWVAHPDLVPVALEEFDAVLGDAPNQVGRLREDVVPNAEALLVTDIDGSTITEAGVRTNISVGIQYIASWLRGNGAAAINNLMEDAATAEISRSQIWQWAHHGAELSDGTTITGELIELWTDEEVGKLREAWGDEIFAASRATEAADLFRQVALDTPFIEFLTIPAYRHID